MLFQKNGFVKGEERLDWESLCKVTSDGQIPDKKKIRRSKRATRDDEERKRRKSCKGIDISTCSQIASFPCR